VVTLKSSLLKLLTRVLSGYIKIITSKAVNKVPSGYIEDITSKAVKKES
jgi:hypothetical protein